MSAGAVLPHAMVRARMLTREAIEAVRFYHGGPKGLAVGEHILPATEVGHARSLDREIPTDGIDDAAWVHVTTERDLAATYASTVAGGGCVYEVAPPWPLRVNRDSSRPDINFRCRRAEIKAVHEVDPREMERRGRMVRSLDARYKALARQERAS